jgi:hypothetical protein
MVCSHIGVRPREDADQVSPNQTVRKGIAEFPNLLRRYRVAQVQIRYLKGRAIAVEMNVSTDECLV